jgi:glucosylceramidase
MTAFRREFPDKPVHFTEGSVFGPQGAVDLAERLRHQASSYNAWVTVLDEQGKPNNGPFPATHAMVKFDTRTRQLEYLHEYFVYGQFMKFVRRGAVRVHSSDGIQTFSNVAFRNPDGTVVLIVANSAKVARDVTVRHTSRALRFALGAESVATLAWKE